MKRLRRTTGTQLTRATDSFKKLERTTVAQLAAKLGCTKTEASKVLAEILNPSSGPKS